MIPWSVPRLWPGATVALVAGGPSLSLKQIRRIAMARAQGRCRAIAVNDAVYPAWWADLCYACDWRWWAKHRGLPGFGGIRVAIDERPKEPPEGCGAVRTVCNTGLAGLEESPEGVRNGRQGGYQAINVAYHLGATRLVLVGYDMKPGAEGETHWFGRHEDWAVSPESMKKWVEHFDELADALRARGVEAVNCTPGSAIDVFRRTDLDSVL